jgi:LysR family hydrogen peroxide-inducible transcriptional activator
VLHSQQRHDSLIEIKPFTRPSPTRTVAIAWRRHYPRKEAIATIRDTIQAAPPEGVDIVPYAS